MSILLRRTVPRCCGVGGSLRVGVVIFLCIPVLHHGGVGEHLCWGQARGISPGSIYFIVEWLHIQS